PFLETPVPSCIHPALSQSLQYHRCILLARPRRLSFDKELLRFQRPPWQACDLSDKALCPLQSMCTLPAPPSHLRPYMLPSRHAGLLVIRDPKTSPTARASPPRTLQT